jgi:hypothetical protein
MNPRHAEHGRLIVPKTITVLALVFAAGAAVNAAAAPAYQGMSYTAFGENVLATAGSDQSIANMAAIGVDTVALNVWWFQDTVASTTMAEDFSLYSATMSSVEHAIDEIHAQGMNVLLKPMLDVKDGTWRAHINPSSPNTWFANYTNFLGTFADLAEEKGVAMFSIGCELNNMENPAHNTRWTNLIDNLRSRYSGPMTYSANWSPAGDPDGGGPAPDSAGGYEDVSWWNQLDYVGIDAYFPVSNNNNPTPAQLQSSWQSLAGTIETWRSNQGLSQPVLFTEVGYQSFDGATQTPWGSSGSVDLQEQADAYDALLSVMSTKPWWDGAFWWSWEPNPFAGGTTDTNFTAQHKPAEAVLRAHYGGTGPPPPTGVQSQTLYSWEDGFEGWEEASFQARPISISQSSEGATHGDQSLAMTQTGDGFSWNIGIALGDDPAFSLVGALKDDPANYRLEFDVTYDIDFIPQASVSSMSVSVAINNNGGWSDVHNLAATNGHTNETIHVSVPLANWGALEPNSFWYDIFIAMNGNWGAGDATVFFDNFQIVNLSAPLPGDYNGDGRVSAADYTIWRDHLGASANLAADGNLNGLVDLPDFETWINHYRSGFSGAGGAVVLAVPEPDGLFGQLLALSLIFFGKSLGGGRVFCYDCAQVLYQVIPKALRGRRCGE